MVVVERPCRQACQISTRIDRVTLGARSKIGRKQEEQTTALKTAGSSFALYVSRGRDARTGIVATQEKCAP